MDKNKNLIIIQDEKDDSINFFLAVKDPKFCWEFIDKYDYITYNGFGAINDEEFDKEKNYHHLKIKFEGIFSLLLKEKIKKFIEEIFYSEIEDEQTFLILLEELSDFFSSTESLFKSFTKLVTSGLIFLNLCDKIEILDEVINVYNDFYDLFGIGMSGLSGLKPLEVTFSQRVAKIVDLEEINNPYDTILVEYMRSSKYNLGIYELINNLEEKIGEAYFIKLKEDLKKIKESNIEQQKIKSLESTNFYFFDRNDLPTIEILEQRKCENVYIKRTFSKFYKYDSKELKDLLLKLFKIN